MCQDAEEEEHELAGEEELGDGERHDHDDDDQHEQHGGRRDRPTTAQDGDGVLPGRRSPLPDDVPLAPVRRPDYSHSIVLGGFDEMSSATRFTSGISLMIREEIVSSRSYGSRAQSAVIASSEVTARITIG